MRRTGGKRARIPPSGRTLDRASRRLPIERRAGLEPRWAGDGLRLAFRSATARRHGPNGAGNKAQDAASTKAEQRAGAANRQKGKTANMDGRARRRLQIARNPKRKKKREKKEQRGEKKSKEGKKRAKRGKKEQRGEKRGKEGKRGEKRGKEGKRGEKRKSGKEEGGGVDGQKSGAAQRPDSSRTDAVPSEKNTPQNAGLFLMGDHISSTSRRTKFGPL